VRSLWLLSLVFFVGCSQKSGIPNQTPATELAAQPSSEDPARALYEQIRGGNVQLHGAADSIEEALHEADSLLAAASAKDKEALSEARALIDSAGAGIADFSAEPPHFDVFRGQIARFDDMRLKAIQEANDSLHDLSEAKGIAKSLQETGGPEISTKVTDWAELIEVASADLADAIRTLGGVIETEN